MPTVQLESLMISLLIDTHEKRDVSTVDKVGDYLLAELEDFILVKVTGTLAKIICQVNLTFEKYSTIEREGWYYIFN